MAGTATSSSAQPLSLMIATTSNPDAVTMIVQAMTPKGRRSRMESITSEVRAGGGEYTASAVPTRTTIKDTSADRLNVTAGRYRSWLETKYHDAAIPLERTSKFPGRRPTNSLAAINPVWLAPVFTPPSIQLSRWLQP